MPDIFLSYSRENDATATRFAEAFRRAGFDVWWDQALRSGETYDEVTERALREAKAVVVLWSRQSVNSRWVRSEAKIADRNGTLIPVMIEPCDRPVMFELTQTTDLTHWKGDVNDKGWCAVVEDVRRLAGRSDSEAQPVMAALRTVRIGGARLALVVSLLLLLGAGTWLVMTGRARFASPSVGTPTIAVLPFVDLTPEGSDTPLAEGLAEEITNWLAQIQGLRVVSRTSSFKFKGANQDVREVGRLLGAAYVMEGSVRRGKNLVRVTVQLVAAGDGYHLWSKSYDVPDGDALRIEDAVSRSVAESLNARLSEETERRWKARQSNGPEANGLYLQGRLQQRLRTPENNLRAMELYRRAIADDPNFPLAYVSLAEATLNSVTLNGRELAAAAADVEPLLDKSLALSPELPEAIAVRGWLAMEQYRTDDALKLMQHALMLNPNDADTHRRLGSLYEQLAQPRQALLQYDVSAQLDPLDFMTHVYRCLGLQDLAKFAEAEAACARARSLNASNVWGPMATSWLAYGKGDLAAALKWINSAAQIAPDEASIQDQRVEVLLALQRYDTAREAVALMPVSTEPARTILMASIAAVQNDQATLVKLIDAIVRRDKLAADELLALSRLQLNAGNVKAASASLELAMRSQDYQPAELVDPSYVRNGFSAAVIVAGVQVANGDRAAALRTLQPLDATLDRMEKDGAACSGLYSLRAESLALRGDPERAMVALQRAYQQGWRFSQSARTEPYLQSLHQRGDFKELMAKIDRQVQAVDVDARALPP
jgi:TolB-like protein/tetratricopeptide (TPR) repeat protein